jgi:hypothetical protein
MLNSRLAHHTAPSIQVREFQLQFQNGQQITTNQLDLSINDDLTLVVIFDELPDTIRGFKVLVDIRKRDERTGASGDFLVDRPATTIEGTLGVDGNPPRVTVHIEHEAPHLSEDPEEENSDGPVPEAVPADSIFPPFHLGPGTYDLIADFTPEDDSGRREDLRFRLSYEFQGFIPEAPPAAPPAAFKNAALQPSLQTP